MWLRPGCFQLWPLGFLAVWVVFSGYSGTVTASDSGAVAADDEASVVAVDKSLTPPVDEKDELPVEDPGQIGSWISGSERPATSRPLRRARDLMKRSISVRNLPKPTRKPPKAKQAKQNKKKRRAVYDADESTDMVPRVLPLRGENYDSEDSVENGSTDEEEESEQLLHILQLPGARSRKAGNMPMPGLVMVVPSRRIFTKTAAGTIGTRKTKKRGMKRASNKQKNVAFFLVAFFTGMLSLIAYMQIAHKFSKDEDGEGPEDASGEAPPVPPSPQQPEMPQQPGPVLPTPQPQPASPTSPTPALPPSPHEPKPPETEESPTPTETQPSIPTEEPPTPTEEPSPPVEREQSQVFERPVDLPVWEEPSLEYSNLDVNILAWKHSHAVCEKVRQLGDVSPEITFHEKGPPEVEKSKKKIVELIYFNNKQRISRPSSNDLSPVLVKEAVMKMSNAEIKDKKIHLSIQGLRKDSTSKVIFEKAEFVVDGILGQGGFSTIYKVRPTEEHVIKAFEGRPLALKVSYMQLNTRNIKTSQLECEGFVATEIAQDQAIMAKLCQMKGKASSLETVQMMHVSHPVLHGRLCEQKSLIVEGFMVSSAVSLSLALLGSVNKVLDASFDKRCPQDMKLTVNDVLYVMRETLKVAAQLNAKHLVHTDLKPDNIFVDNEGGIHLGDLHGMIPVRSEINMFTPRFMPPEAASHSRVASLQVDAWALGVTAYLMITGVFPFNINPDQPMDQLNSSLQKLKLYQNVETMSRKIQCPSIVLRERGVPDPWVDIITALLEPFDWRRPSIPQIVQAFPDVFKAK